MSYMGFVKSKYNHPNLLNMPVLFNSPVLPFLCICEGVFKRLSENGVVISNPSNYSLLVWLNKSIV